MSEVREEERKSKDKNKSRDKEEKKTGVIKQTDNINKNQGCRQEAQTQSRWTATSCDNRKGGTQK